MNHLARARRFLRIQEQGCLCCRRFGVWSVPEIHHLNEGGHAGQKRRGDEFTIGLCSWHHRGIRSFLSGTLGPSLALNSREFRERFGSDDELLAAQNELIQVERVPLIQEANV
jgi:hypothetical protein